MPQKLVVDRFKWKKMNSRFSQKFIQIYNDDSDKAYTLDVGFDYLMRLQKIHKDPLLLLEKRKTKKNCVVHIKTLKLALEYGLILEKVHRVVKFNLKAQFEP